MPNLLLPIEDLFDICQKLLPLKISIKEGLEAFVPNTDPPGPLDTTV